MEGEPIQELSALAVDSKTLEVMDIFHHYGDYSASDKFARVHVHGLSKHFLSQHSVGSESKLINKFLIWLEAKNVKAIYANNPTKEVEVLGLPVINYPLSNWIDRQDNFLHQLTIRLKNNSHDFCHRCCPAEAHSAYIQPYKHKNPAITEAKAKHGFHCSFYDVVELFLTFYYMTR